MSFGEIMLSLLDGFQTSCLIFALTLVFALPLGLLISFGSMSKFGPLRHVTKTFVWIIRGVPLMLQVIIIFYVPGILWHWDIKAMRFPAVIIAFSINYACYFSEIYRGGIENISHSQFEAGQVLGMTRLQIFSKVVLLQVVKRILAPMSNEIITLIKDTALARVIMVVEIIQKAEEFSSKGLILPLFYTGAFYLAFVGILTLLFGYFEKRLDYFRA